jgi:hypothetical protein
MERPFRRQFASQQARPIAPLHWAGPVRRGRAGAPAGMNRASATALAYAECQMIYLIRLARRRQSDSVHRFCQDDREFALEDYYGVHSRAAVDLRDTLHGVYYEV